MDPLAGKVPKWKQLYHQWKSLRSVPFRRRWFVGYDLEGNSFWEFQIESHGKMRRLVDYRIKSRMIGELSQRQLHPHWSSWLRFIRYEPPTLQELLDNEKRKQEIKVLAARADARWKQESVLEDDKRILLQMMSTAREKVQQNGQPQEQNKEQHQEHPIQTAQLQPKR